MRAHHLDGLRRAFAAKEAVSFRSRMLKVLLCIRHVPERLVDGVFALFLNPADDWPSLIPNTNDGLIGCSNKCNGSRWLVTSRAANFSFLSMDLLFELHA